ncbi:uncharacterized protein RJT20DRAFT_96912 [Scheffersomyces xylosifermentans]|uniref:uncharacterized protein n=1 Tax=Scheffersomyces xylosifermentans TaxID=1304137 RepID=UPI00315C8AB9
MSLQNWPSASPQLQVAIRTQRDVSKPVPIDQLVAPGLSLNSMVFEKEGYTLAALTDIASIIGVGVQNIMLDLYWNEFTKKWQLCPAPFPVNATFNLNSTVNVTWNKKTYQCAPSLTVNSLMEVINQYILGTHTNMDVNLIQILLNLKSIHYINSNQTKHFESAFISQNATFNALGNSTLNDTFSAIGSYIFTPIDLANYRSTSSSDLAYQSFYNMTTSALPSLETVLLTYFRRVFINVVSNELVGGERGYNFTASDNNTVFFRGDDLPSTITSNSDSEVLQECYNLENAPEVNLTAFNSLSLNTHFRYVIDNDKKPFSNDTFVRYLRCGYSPILNASSYEVSTPSGVKQSSRLSEISNNFIPVSFWSWAPGEPVAMDSNSTYAAINNMSVEYVPESNDGSQVAYKCVAISEDGWTVENCYKQYQYACQGINSPHEWIIKGVRKQYFEAYKETCPNGYKFSLPFSSVEMLSLVSSIRIQNASYPVWIDLNDITVSDCFVSGGPYAECPYQRTVTEAKLASLIAPSFVVGVVVLVLIFMEKFIRVNPIQSNRKRYWKKTIQEYNKKHDYEGVPS